MPPRPERSALTEGDGDPDMGDVFEELEELADIVDSPEEREQVREAMKTLNRAKAPTLFNRARGTVDPRDIGEQVVGAVIFGVPMVVEGGTLEVGATLATSPLGLAATLAFGVGLVVGILRAVNFQESRGSYLLGLVPRRLVGILAVATGLALFMMTTWGRVDWSDPWLATCQCAITAVVMAVGASLGDILPGE